LRRLPGGRRALMLTDPDQGKHGGILPKPPHERRLGWITHGKCRNEALVGHTINCGDA
jgi:hypothetical protein